MKLGSENVKYAHANGIEVFKVPEGLDRFKAIVVVEKPVTGSWRAEAANELIATGCVYMLAWGHDCLLWDDDVDSANLERCDYNIPDDKHVMTTWHSDETLEQVFEFAKTSALTDMNDTEIRRCLILHIAEKENREHVLLLYERA